MQAPGSIALGLGYGGLLPFVAGAIAVWYAPPAVHATALLALAAYAAVIVSFLGGIHWGLAMRHPAPATLTLVWGVIPSLVAWAALLMPLRMGLVVQALALLACYAVDHRLYRAAGVRAWLPLRLRLSAVAASCCITGAAGA